MRTLSAARRGLLVALMGLGVGVMPAAAQDRDGRRPDRQEMEERFRRQMGRMIQERLRLDDAQAEALFEQMRVFDDRRRQLAREEYRIRRQIDDILEADDSDAAEAEAEALLVRMREVKEAELLLLTEEQEAFGEMLSAVQVLRLNELREDLARRIRRLRGGDDGRRRRGDGDRGYPPEASHPLPG